MTYQVTTKAPKPDSQYQINKAKNRSTYEQRIRSVLVKDAFSYAHATGLAELNAVELAPAFASYIHEECATWYQEAGDVRPSAYIRESRIHEDCVDGIAEDAARFAAKNFDPAFRLRASLGGQNSKRRPSFVVRDLIGAHGMSAAALAEKIGCSRPTASRLRAELKRRVEEARSSAAHLSDAELWDVVAAQDGTKRAGKGGKFVATSTHIKHKIRSFYRNVRKTLTLADPADLPSDEARMRRDFANSVLADIDALAPTPKRGHRVLFVSKAEWQSVDDLPSFFAARELGISEKRVLKHRKHEDASREEERLAPYRSSHMNTPKYASQDFMHLIDA